MYVILSTTLNSLTAVGGVSLKIDQLDVAKEREREGEREIKRERYIEIKNIYHNHVYSMRSET